MRRKAPVGPTRYVVMVPLRLRRPHDPARGAGNGASAGSVVRDTYLSPVGVLRLVVSRDGLHALRHSTQPQSTRGSGSVRGNGASAAQVHLESARAWLDAYFDGQPLPPPPPLVADATPLQQRVWAELDTVGPGETIGFSALAARLRLPTPPVVTAVAANPIVIIRGSHRVFGWEGDTAGYRGGLHVKRWLMLHEQAAYR